MKNLLSLLGISLAILILIGGSCGWSGFQMARAILNNQESRINNQFFRWCFNGLPFVDKLAQILDNKTYLVLLQNNTELRPSGGFLGSYARIETAATGIKNISVQDIYVPDGQLVGHVDPPLPIQQAFGQGWWKLRDSNWDPDFKIAGEQIAWFFDQGGEKVDGLIAVNLNLVTDLLTTLGPVQPLDYPELVADKTLNSLAQKYSDVNSFPGSTQKKDYLGAVGRALILKIKQAKPKQLINLAKILFINLKNKQILLWFKDPDLEGVARQRDWTGELSDYTGNYLYLVETNLGANKANCCISRSVNQQISGSSHRLEVHWQNDNPYSNPVKPFFWGGDYVDYVRVIVPIDAKVQSVKVAEQELINKPLDDQYGLQEDRYQVEDRGKFKIIGFWAKVPAQQSVTATLNYQLSTVNSSILIKRQPGIDGFDYKLVVSEDTIYNQRIIQDTIIKIDN